MLTEVLCSALECDVPDVVGCQCLRFKRKHRSNYLLLCIALQIESKELHLKKRFLLDATSQFLLDASVGISNAKHRKRHSTVVYLKEAQGFVFEPS